MQDRGLGKPATDDLHIDGQALLARAKPHRDLRQAGDVERHGSPLKVGGIDGLPVDDELVDAMLVRGDRQHMRDERVEATEGSCQTNVPVRPRAV